MQDVRTILPYPGPSDNEKHENENNDNTDTTSYPQTNKFNPKSTFFSSSSKLVS